MRSLLLRTALFATVVTTAATPVIGQQMPTMANASTAALQRPASPANSNVRLDLTISDTYTTTPAEKTVTMLILNSEVGMIRTSNTLPNGFDVGLNVDARVLIVPGTDQVRVSLTFEYTPAQIEYGGDTPGRIDRPVRPAKLNESLTVLLKDGEPLMVSQSADPATERKVAVTLTATVATD
jgi:hypothetical protein